MLVWWSYNLQVFEWNLQSRQCVERRWNIAEEDGAVEKGSQITLHCSRGLLCVYRGGTELQLNNDKKNHEHICKRIPRVRLLLSFRFCKLPVLNSVRYSRKWNYDPLRDSHECVALQKILALVALSKPMFVGKLSNLFTTVPSDNPGQQRVAASDGLLRGEAVIANRNHTMQWRHLGVHDA